MKIKDKGKFITDRSLSIVDAMIKMDENGYGILFIIDGDGRLKKTLSDGDIRRWLIKTGDLNADIEEIANKQPRYITADFDGDVNGYMAGQHITAVPVVDDSMRIVDIIINRTAISSDQPDNKDALSNIDVIVMAGGKGTRLYPYTKILPKPLIPIGEIPILERILDRFYRYGVKHFYLTVNYKKEMIRAYFSDVKHPYTISYVEEEEPLGTAGSISYIEKRFDRPVIVTNCDILIEADYNQIMEFHRKNGNDITIVSSLKNTVIPYGVLHSEKEGLVTSMEEKPKLSYFINTGMYIINPEFLEWIPADRVFHMPDLVQKMMEAGRRVGMYPISEKAFLDMGEFAEMKRMEEKINSGEL